MVFGLFKSRDTAPTVDLSALAAQADEQLRVGEQLFTRLTQAARDNRRRSDTWYLIVGKLTSNAGKYSVVVQLKDDYGRHTMMQFDVCVADKKFTSLYGPYGPREEFGLEEFETFCSKAFSHVKNFE